MEHKFEARLIGKGPQGAFASLAYSHRKEYADWISSAKKAETKAARCRKAVLMLGAGQKLK